jgi:uncharacterized protein
LKPAELKALIEDTSGQWSDGIGEACFDYLEEERGVRIDCLPADQGKALTAEHVDDGVTVPKPKKSPLLTPAAKGDVAKLEKLLAKGEDINARDIKTGRSVLMVALGAEQVDAAIMLIDRGADLKARDKLNWTPLQLATRFNLVTAAQALLDKGADVNEYGSDGYPVLGTAALSNHIAMLDLLHARGADINLRDDPKKERGRTPIMYANYPEGAQWFLDHGADLAIQNDKGQDALAFARWMQSSEERRGDQGLARECAARWKQIGDMIETAVKAKV